MTAETTKAQKNPQFGWTLPTKIISGVVLVGLSTLVVPLTPFFSGPAGTAWFVLFGLLIGGASWVASAGWMFKLEVTPTAVQMTYVGQTTTVPLDKIGMLVRNNGRIPFLPSLWLVLRGVDIGREIPETRIDPHTKELIDNFRRRNPGKKITYVSFPAGHLRSVSGFVAEMKRRIPPLGIDDRLGGK